MLRGSISLALLLALGQLLAATQVYAVRPSEQLLPNTTKGYLSIPDMDALQAAFEKTQLGELTRDPLMKPFADDLKRQLRERLSESGVRLELTLEDLEDVYGGEICLAMTQPGGDATAFAVVVMVDVTGHLEQANALLAKIDRNQLDKGAKKATRQVAGVTVVSYTLPKSEEQPAPVTAHYFLHNDQLVAADHEGVVNGILTRLAGGGENKLADVVAFRECMTRCVQRSGDAAPHLRWFVEPFGYTQTVRAARGGRQRRGTDYVQVLKDQGFDAVQGIGGFVTFAAGADEILHRTLIYAPPVPGAESGEKYKLAARMLDFGPGRDLSPPKWLPRGLATYFSFSWEMKEAFYHAETLVNRIADDDIFWDVIKSIRDDPHGPQIDVEHDLVAHLGKRATLASDYQLPITPQSERLLMAIEMNDPTPVVEEQFAQRDVDGNGKITENEVPKNRRGYFRRLLRKFDDNKDGGLTKAQYVKARSVAVTIEMAMENDPDAKAIQVGDHTVWEIAQSEDDEVADDELPEIDIDFAGLASIADIEEEEEEEEEKKPEPLISNWAVCALSDRVLASTHVNMLVDLLEGAGADGTLAGARDYKEVTAALERLGAAKDNARYFARTDEAYRITYEMMRQGKMPEADTMLAKILNRMLGSGEEGVVRRQEIDAGKLPEYQVARRYLGPAGIYMRAEPAGDGWFVVGTLLRK